MECFNVPPAIVTLLKAYSPLIGAQVYGFEPADGFVDGTNIQPHVFVYLSSSEFKPSNGGESSDQQHDPTYFCDVYGFGKSKASGAENDGLVAAQAAQISAQTTFGHCYNVIMDMRRKFDSFGLTQDAGGRYVRRIESFKPGRLTDSSIGVCVIRLEFTVSVVETPPGETDGPDLDGQGVQIVAHVTEPVT